MTRAEAVMAIHNAIGTQHGAGAGFAGLDILVADFRALDAKADQLSEYQTYAITLQKIIMALAGPDPLAALEALGKADPVRKHLVVWPVALRLCERIEPQADGEEYDEIKFVQSESGPE